LSCISFSSAYTIYDNYVLEFNDSGIQANKLYVGLDDRGIQCQSRDFFNGNHTYSLAEFYNYKLDHKLYITSLRYFHNINEPLPKNFITGATPLFDGNNWSITNHQLINRTLDGVQLYPDGSIDYEIWMSYYNCDVTLINTIPYKLYGATG
jgi:hypothetical protein